jgi:hypothetical protein
MSKTIIILDDLGDPLSSTANGTVKNIVTASRVEEINGENTLDFTAVLDEKMLDFLTANSVLALGGYKGEYFDANSIEWSANEDSTYTVVVEADHISYRLNTPVYDIKYFSKTGTPSEILGYILDGTDFSVGSVEFAQSMSYTTTESKSRRQLLMEFAKQLDAELFFYDFTISLVRHFGSTQKKPVIKDKDVTVVSKKINKRELDDNKNPSVTYNCTSASSVGDEYELGDEVLLIHSKLGIRESLRILKKTYNPYDDSKTEFVFGSSKNNELSRPIYDLMSNSGAEKINSTTLSVNITANGPFFSSAWTHGFDTDEEIVQFSATVINDLSSMYSGSILISNLGVVKLGPKAVRIFGTAGGL